MRVLYVCHSPYHLGGAALSLYNLIKSVKNDVEPIVLLQDRGETFDYFTSKNIKCIVVNFRNNMRHPNLVMHYIGFLPKLIYYTIINMICARKVCSLLRNVPIDIVHSNATVFTFGYLIAKKLKAKHVWHLREFQDIDFGISPFLGWKNLKNKMLSSDAVISITKAVHMHWGMDKHKNAYYFWDAVRSKYDCVNYMPKDLIIIHCAAKLSEAKGSQLAIEAFGKSQLNKIGYRLKMIGLCDQKYKSILENTAKKYECENSIDYLGFCENLRPILSKASAFLMCSKNEGLGRVTIEAMFYGCLVIGHRTAGTLEVIQNKVNGLLFDSVDECKYLLAELPSMKNYGKIISNAQKYVVSNFSEEEYGQKVLNVYYSII